MAYCIDTSAIVDGWVRYYPRDVFPTLWDKLEKMIAAGRLVAPDEVLKELSKNDDDLHKWARLQDGLFCPLEDDVQIATAEILAVFPKLVNNERNRSIADPFVVAVAKVRKLSVVTGEKRKGNPMRPKIPDVCDAYKIRCLTLLELMKSEGWRFR
jgi:predicted nucleic acid-binding protein